MPNHSRLRSMLPLALCALANLPLGAPAYAAELAPPAWAGPGAQGMPAPMIEGLRRLLDTPQGYLATNQTPALYQIHAVDAQSAVSQGLFGFLMRRLPIGFEQELEMALSSSNPLQIQRALDAVASAHRQAQPDVVAAMKARLAELSKTADSMTPEQLEAEAAKISAPLSFYGGEAALQGAAISQLAKDRREGRLVSAERQIAQALAPTPADSTSGAAKPAEQPNQAPAVEVSVPAPAAVAEPPVSLSAPTPKQAPALAPIAPDRIKTYVERLADSQDVYDSLKLADKLLSALGRSQDETAHGTIFEALIGGVSQDNDSDYVAGLARRLERASALSPFSQLHEKAVEALLASAIESSDADYAGRLLPSAAAIAAASPSEKAKDTAIEKMLQELKDSSDDSYTKLLADETARIIESLPSAFTQPNGANSRLVDALIARLGSADDYDGERQTVASLASAARRDPAVYSRVIDALAKQISDSQDDGYTQDVVGEIEALAQGPDAPASRALANGKLVDALIGKLGSAEDSDGELDLARAMTAAATRDGGEPLQLRVANRLVKELSEDYDDDYVRDVADELGRLAAASPFASVREAAVEGIVKAAQDSSDWDLARRLVTNVAPIAETAEPAVKERAVALLMAELEKAEDDDYIAELKDQVALITGQEPVVTRPQSSEETTSVPAEPATTSAESPRIQAEPATAPAESASSVDRVLRILFRIVTLVASIALALAVLRYLLRS